MAELDTLINKLEGMHGMSSEDVLEHLKQMKTQQACKGEHKSSLAPLIERAPTGAFPQAAGRRGFAAIQKTSEERERARKYGFPASRLMVLTDGSANADKAIEAALHYRRRNDHIHFVTCAQLQDEYRNTAFQRSSASQQSIENAKSVMEDIKDCIKERGLGRWETAILPSMQPQQAVVDYIDNNHIDLVFIGTRGLDETTQDFFPESFSKYVLNNSPCSVLLVR